MSNSEEKGFAPQERELHKKETRVHNSLGALLLGLGGNKGASDSTSNGNDNQNHQQKNEEKRDSRKTVIEKKPYIAPAPYTSTKADFGWSAAGPNMDNMDGGNCRDEVEQQEKQQEPHYDHHTNKKQRVDEPFVDELEHWGEAKKLDDDLDKEWLEHQHKELNVKHGEGIITVKYTEHGTLGYYCELCFAVMNAIKPLEMHCSGMKHLKKKDIYDKSKAKGGSLLMERTKKLEPLNESTTSRGGRSDHEPPQRYSREGNYDRDRYGRDEYARNEGREPYNRGGYARNEGREPYNRGGYGSRGERGERDPYRDERDYRDDYDRDSYGRGRVGRFEAPPIRNDPYADRYPKDDLRDYAGYDRRRDGKSHDDYRGDPNDRPYPSGDLGRHSADRPYPPAGELRQSSMDRLRHKDERSPYGIDRPLSGEMSRHSADRPYPGNSLHHSTDYWDDRRSHTSDVRVKIPSPPSAKLPVPAPIISTPAVESQSLAGGPAAALLTKLSQCTVKNENDSDLASNVINLLLKSLKEYNQKLGEKSVADLMEQAEIKLGTAKAIRTVRKPAVTTNPLQAISLAMDTLRRANIENPPAFSSLGNPLSAYKGF